MAGFFEVTIYTYVKSEFERGEPEGGVRVSGVLKEVPVCGKQECHSNHKIKNTPISYKLPSREKKRNDRGIDLFDRMSGHGREVIEIDALQR